MHPENIMKMNSLVFAILPANTVSNNKKNPVSKVLKTTIPQICRLFLCHRRPFLKVSWKSIHPFSSYAATSLATVPSWRVWNTITWHETVKPFFSCVISGVCWRSYENAFSGFLVTLLTNTDPENRKKSCGVKYNIPRILQIVPGAITDISWQFYENPSVRFP